MHDRSRHQTRSALVTRLSFRTPVIGAILGALLTPNHALAQVDVNPQLPNVLVLVDSSGSMELMIDGRPPERSEQACRPGTETLPNRWGIAIQALAGRVQPFYSCEPISRHVNPGAGTPFTQEFNIGGMLPPDANYRGKLPSTDDYDFPYHRPVSGGMCVYGPGRIDGPIGLGADFPDAAAPHPHVVDHLGTACNFTQAPDGILDSASSFVRFGFMTFDQEPSPRIGVTMPDANGPATLLDARVFEGTFSYFEDWWVPPRVPPRVPVPYAEGGPKGCATPSPYEVGARNPAAPPWEGRMVPFPAPNVDQSATNAKIRQILNSVRPYGATPTAGLLTDAEYYLRRDPTGPSGRNVDPTISGPRPAPCRKQFIILLTDGMPNQDLRPECEGSTPDTCPYRRPEEIARSLALADIETFVIGFAISSERNARVSCTELDERFSESGWPACSTFLPTAPELPCCKLAEIAREGSIDRRGKAYFADDERALRLALEAIIAKLPRLSTTRTFPVYSSVSSSSATVPAGGGGPPVVANAALLGVGARFSASLVPRRDRPWSGNIIRERYTCPAPTDGSAYPIPASNGSGDNFQENIRTGMPPRQFYAYRPNKDCWQRRAHEAPARGDTSIRPWIRARSSADGCDSTGPDHLPLADADAIFGAADAIVNNVPPEALGITARTPGNCPPKANGDRLTDAECAKLALSFLLAQEAAPIPATSPPFASRKRHELGGIYHSTPAIIGPPSSFSQDPSYLGFAHLNRRRETMLYVATIDGLLHAFDANVTGNVNNERWALIPPAVMPKILSGYPSGFANLLDGSPVVRDVVWQRGIGDTTNRCAEPATCPWHTSLVAGFGPAGPGYYSVDVTDPRPLPASRATRLRWQITGLSPEALVGMPQQTDQVIAAKRTTLFDSPSPTPAIGSVVLTGPHCLGGPSPCEVGVAILPGGGGDNPPDGPPIARPTTSVRSADRSPANYKPRLCVRNWSRRAGASLSVVRLDTGEVIRSFWSGGTDLHRTFVDNRVTAAPLSAPMTGIPALFPPDIGTPIQKVFVGDANGVLWRFNLTNPNPALWQADLFFDGYSPAVTQRAACTACNDACLEGAIAQPIQLAPVISLDANRNLAIQFATGDQNNLTTPGMNFVYSLSEVRETRDPDAPTLRAKLNWYVRLSTFVPIGSDGHRVVGPMSVFNNNLYFATYAPAPQTAACQAGKAYVWGMNFVTPRSADLALGGRPAFVDACEGDTPCQYTDATRLGTAHGGVIPGVAVHITPACGGAGRPGAGVFGVPAAAGESVASLAIASGSGGRTANSPADLNATTREIPLPTPRTGPTINSWATVVEGQ